MRERARIAGGTLRISSNANSGTVVSVRIPARRETSSRAAAG
jgi:signal transduction histidine kinase